MEHVANVINIIVKIQMRKLNVSKIIVTQPVLFQREAFVTNVQNTHIETMKIPRYVLKIFAQI